MGTITWKAKIVATMVALMDTMVMMTLDHVNVRNIVSFHEACHEACTTCFGKRSTECYSC